MLEKIVTDPWFGVANFVLAVFGIVLAVYYYYKQRNKKALRYALRDKELVGLPEKCGDSIGITYGGRPVSSVRRAGVLLWNAGDVTIDFEDDLRWVKFSVPGNSILGAYVAKADDAGGGFKIEPDGDTALITFNDLRSREGCLFYIDYESSNANPQLRVEEKHKDISRRFSPMTPGLRVEIALDLAILMVILTIFVVARFLQGEMTAMLSIPLAAIPLLVFVYIIGRHFFRKRKFENALGAYRSEFL